MRSHPAIVRARAQLKVGTVTYVPSACLLEWKGPAIAVRRSEDNVRIREIILLGHARLRKQTVVDHSNVGKPSDTLYRAWDMADHLPLPALAPALRVAGRMIGSRSSVEVQLLGTAFQDL